MKTKELIKILEQLPNVEVFYMEKNYNLLAPIDVVEEDSDAIYLMGDE